MLGERINLHSKNLKLNIFDSSLKNEIENFEISLKFKLLDLIDLSTHLYENGYHAKQIVEFFVFTKRECRGCLDYDLLNLFYYKLIGNFCPEIQMRCVYWKEINPE